MESSTIAIIITAMGVVLSSSIAGLFGWLGSRNKAKQSDLDELVKKQKEEIKELRDVNKINEVRIKDLETEIKQQIREKEVISERKQELSDALVDLQKQLIEANRLVQTLRTELADAKALVNELKNKQTR